ncbi:MAG TPA: nitroreductase/quinone reductase family protein [Candidatus Dormibacteraeota bacterium]
MSQFLHQILRTHQWIYEHTDGFLGHRLLFGNPTLLLRTTGRRTGLPRTNALTYARDGDASLIVASKGGAPTPPMWLANLTANPRGRRISTLDLVTGTRFSLLTGVGGDAWTAAARRAT